MCLWYLHKDQWNRNEIPETSYLIINSGVKALPKGKNHLSANNPGITGDLRVKEQM